MLVTLLKALTNVDIQYIFTMYFLVNSLLLSNVPIKSISLLFCLIMVVDIYLYLRVCGENRKKLRDGDEYWKRERKFFMSYIRRAQYLSLSFPLVTVVWFLRLHFKHRKSISIQLEFNMLSLSISVKEIYFCVQIRVYAFAFILSHNKTDTLTLI